MKACPDHAPIIIVHTMLSALISSLWCVQLSPGRFMLSTQNAMVDVIPKFVNVSAHTVIVLQTGSYAYILLWWKPAGTYENIILQTDAFACSNKNRMPPPPNPHSNMLSNVVVMAFTHYVSQILKAHTSMSYLSRQNIFAVVLNFEHIFPTAKYDQKMTTNSRKQHTN